MPSDSSVTCDDCFFRRNLLCALRLPGALPHLPPRDARRARTTASGAPRSTAEHRGGVGYPPRMNVPGSDSRRPEQTLYLVVGLIAIGVLYAVGFIIENSKHVTVDFVLFSTGTSLIVVILFTLILGLARRRRTHVPVPARASPRAAHLDRQGAL